ncbi:JIL-1 anchoring and stabilizing protein [Leptinotarsa decemlineata]|uniref:JIL-1 anchoring and stabilizing protein n=1 Tax=Leptinotarsa decemlineata TaxID=7539 RepID=UPI003D307FF4
MKKPNFKVGDKVFAKVKGYPPWPAHIVAENGKKFNVEFYGTKETGVIKIEDLSYYTKNKEKFQKPLKRKDYVDAFEQIEAAILEDGGDGDENPDTNDSISNISMNSSIPLNVSAKEKKTLKKDKLTTKSSDSNESISDKNEASQNEVETPASTPKDKKSTKRDRSVSGKPTEGSPAKKSARLSKPDEGSITSEENETMEAELATPVKKSPRNQKLKKEKEKDTDNEESSKAKEFEFVPIGSKTVENKEDLDKKEIQEKMEEKAESLDFKIGIVSEKYLKNNITYANHIKEFESIYKEKPVEPREDFISQVLPVKLPSGVMGGIKLHLNWPIKFTNEYERALYDETVATRVLDAKSKIFAGDMTIVNNHELFIPNIEQTAEDIKHSLYMKEIEAKKFRIDRLKLEADLVDLDVKIKNCLGLDKANPKEALGYLEKMCQIGFDDVMLKKHLHIVEMVRRLRKYVGNTKEWNMSDESLTEFSSQAEKVRAMAENVYAKFKKVVKLPENSTSFFDGFTELASQFRADCKDLDLTEAEVFVLCTEPRSRKAFLDRLEEKETEKENSSGVANNEQDTSINGTSEIPAEES